MNKRIPAAVAGILVLGAALGLGAGTASAAGTAGALDGTFGHGGIVSTDVGSPSAAAGRGCRGAAAPDVRRRAVMFWFRRDGGHSQVFEQSMTSARV